MATASTYTITGYTELQAGEYTCAVTATAGNTTTVISSGLTVSTSANGTAAYGSFVQTGEATGGTASGTYAYTGAFSAYTPTSAACTPVTNSTCPVTQTRERPTSENYTGAVADGIQTCEMVTGATGRGVAGTCSGNAIGTTNTVVGQFTGLTRTVSVTPTEANGGVSTRPQNVPNTNFSVDGTAEYSGYTRTGAVTGGGSTGFTIGTFGAWTDAGTTPDTQPYLNQYRVASVSENFANSLQNGVRTCVEVTAASGGGAAGTCSGSPIGTAQTSANHFSDPNASVSRTATLANGGREERNDVDVNPNYIATATYNLTDSTTGGGITIASVDDQTGSIGGSYSFTDPTVSVDGAYQTDTAFSFAGDSLTGTFTVDDITVNRTVTGATSLIPVTATSASIDGLTNYGAPEDAGSVTVTNVLPSGTTAHLTFPSWFSNISANTATGSSTTITFDVDENALMFSRSGTVRVLDKPTGIAVTLTSLNITQSGAGGA